MNYSFIELQKQYKIIIPQIQRDYAQGRIDSNNKNKIRAFDFILKIIEVLTSEDRALNLDFVYGYTKEIAENQSAFIPLDGQQRLTTLWLLHWYVSPKKEIVQDKIKMQSTMDEVKKWLDNFTYETRNSSKRFCEKLISEFLPVSDDIASTIKDASWFMASWQNDPTVISMLNMLDAIQKQNFDKEKAWQNLVENRKITFDYIDIKSNEFKLTDELYIKMNSRGKPLTPFENFKAQFSEILSASDTDYIDERLDYKGTRITFQQYFAFKIDGEWTDLFWQFNLFWQIRKSNANDADDVDISSCFMNFFIYMAQMAYFKDNTNKKVDDFENDFTVFKKKENALFLFETLDFFYKMSIDTDKQINTSQINNFFESLFLIDANDNSNHQKIRPFDENKINLFENCLLDGNQFDNRNRILLYCIISYIIKYKLQKVDDNLRFYIRVVRNLLQATRQRNETTYNTNVRINSFGNYWKLFNQLQEKPNVYERLLENIDNKETDISDDALANEKEKAEIATETESFEHQIEALLKLENSPCFSGLIHNIAPKDNVHKLNYWSESFDEIWACEDKLIAAALISCGYEGFQTKGCSLGEMRLFGEKNNWNTILSAQSKIDSKISEPLISLLSTFQKKKLSNSKLAAEKILEQIIQEFLDKQVQKNWQYYFCKYREDFLSGSNYYSWLKDFECEILGNTGSNPLLSYHINPYVKTVSNLLDDAICQENWCYARYSDESCLVLHNGFGLYSKQDGWKIKMPNDQPISDKLKEKMMLLEAGNKDRIEIAVEFCKELF